MLKLQGRTFERNKKVVIKQKYSAATSVAVYALLFGALLFGWVALQQLPLSFHSFQEPTLGSPIVLAKEPVEEQIPVKDKRTELAELLQAEILNFSHENPTGWSIYIEDLATGASAEHTADEQMMAASMYKLFIANEALKMVDDGKLLMNATIDGERGLSLEECLEEMITVSDNDCGVILQRVTGAANSQLSQLRRQGFDGTDLRGFFPLTTTRDIGRLYRNLINQNYLSSASNQLFLDLLADQQINDRLPRGLPGDVQFMHKTGDLNGFAHDGGVVRTAVGHEYIIVVMSSPEAKDGSLTARYKHFADLATRVHEIITSEVR